MATLHVRNVPEPLYEALRRCAEENGRSIASQAVALLNESLSTGRRGFPFFRSRPGSGAPLQSFGEAVRSAVVDAQILAREFGHTHVGTDDLLLALISDPRGPVAEALATPPNPISHLSVRRLIQPGEGSKTGALPFSPDAKQALELALRESLKTRGMEIESDHLLLGIASASGPGAAILAELGLGPDELRTKLLTSSTTTKPLRRYRVVELEGEADEWEEQLAAASEGPYELREIVGTRAIFELRRP
jgi:hypothetical protein